LDDKRTRGVVELFGFTNREADARNFERVGELERVGGLERIGISLSLFRYKIHLPPS
jgi:hypothetical protein